MEETSDTPSRRHHDHTRLLRPAPERLPRPRPPDQQRGRGSHAGRRARPGSLPDRPRRRLLHRQPRARRAGQGRDSRLGFLHRSPLPWSGGGQLRRPPLQLMGGNSPQADQIVNQIAISIANWSTGMAVASIRWLLATLGQSTEPDLAAIAPVYDRMLAISLLVLGGVIALALIERIAWGSLGTTLAIVPRVIAATFFAYAGLGLVKYVAGYSALLATAWSPDFTQLTDTLMRHVAVSDAATRGISAGAHVSTFGLILTALTLCCLTVMVHLELVV